MAPSRSYDPEHRTILSAFAWEEEAEYAQAYLTGDPRIHPLRFHVVPRRRAAAPVLSDLLERDGAEWVRLRLVRDEAVLVADVPAGEAWVALRVLVEKALSTAACVLPGGDAGDRGRDRARLLAGTRPALAKVGVRAPLG
ncbi:MAG TPA: hypothetical protein VG245_00180 [Candidatus Dormibacteraeota bacterium]|jgi:hypothetical protein|nr:hypothetical protein [Candidatus Dormibacteraeota bacterium]